MASGQKTVIVVAGPTASGKTAVGISLARHFKAGIISADSRQCYKEMNIGVARPSSEELQAVPHYFIATHSIHEEVTAASFEAYALQKAEELFRSSDTIIMVGGTGLYIRVFCEGLDTIPATDPSIREAIIRNYEEYGLAWLQEQVREKDPAFFAEGEIQNPRRLMRALEVVQSTGMSVIGFRTGKKKQRPFRILKIGLELPKDQLLRNINTRTGHMVESGLVEEVKALLPFRHQNALQTVGYSELFAHFDGQLSLEQAVEEIKIHTRQYAKRQFTWFRKDKEITWFHPADLDKIKEHLEGALVS